MAAEWLLAVAAGLAAKGAMRWRYEINRAEPYGPVWKGRRPPGLPADARLASVEGAALPQIDRAARGHRLGDRFVATVLQLARAESYGGRFGLPANNFNDLPPDQRGGRPKITAWGAFQWNEGAGKGADHLADLGIPGVAVGPDWKPWHWTAREEVELPVSMYAQIFGWVLQHGGDELDGARAVRLWHAGSGWGRAFLSAGAGGRFRRLWASSSSWPTRRIDDHLAKAGVV